MNAFIFASNVNHPEVCPPQWPNDATGSFIPGAKAFKKTHDLDSDIFWFDHHWSAADKRQRIIHEIQTIPEPLDAIAYFGHGVKNGLSSVDFYIANVPELAATILSKAADGIQVILYACDTGVLSNDGFAATLARALATKNATVYGHLPPPGHAFANPMFAEFTGTEPGRLVIDRMGPAWKPWVDAFEAGRQKPEVNTLWARFPMMSQVQIEDELLNRKPTWRDQSLTGLAATIQTRHGGYE